MRSKTKKVMALMLTLAFVLSMGVASSFAAEPINGTNVTFDTYLVMPENANVPNATFEYSIEPGDPVAGSSTSQEILAGPVSPSVGTAVFAPGDTNSAVKAADKPAAEPVTVASGEKYVKKAVTVTLTGVQFSAPGIYRYKISQTAATIAGVTNDSAADRYLDVYVEATGTNGALSILGSLLHDVEGTRKKVGYENKYAASDLTISKAVSGNQAYREKRFQFTVSISGAAEGTVYTVTPSRELGTPDSGTVAPNPNPATLTVNNEGKATGVYYLMHNESIVIKGMVAGTSYTVTEVNEDYTATYVHNGGTSTAGNEVTGTIGATNTVAFTNTRAGTVPTGILMDVAPYVLIVALAGAMLLLLGLKKRKTER